MKLEQPSLLNTQHTQQHRLVFTHVLQGSRPRVLLFEAEGVEALSASEVHDLDGVEVGHHDVVGLEVQVEDAAVVEVLDSLEDLDRVTRHVVLGVTEPLVSRKRVDTERKGFFNITLTY